MPNFTTITVQQAAEKLNSGHTLLLDIRDELSFNRGHVAQSALLNDHNLPQFLLQHDYDTPMMVLCYHGISSRGAAQYLINQGFEEVYSVDGGFEAWERNYPEHIEHSAVE